MKVLFTQDIFMNPLPQLKGKHSMFPYVCELKDSTLLASHTVGEAFESVDSSAHVSFSYDGGETWSEPCKMFDKSEFNVPISDYCKVCTLPDGRLMALGYAFFRNDPSQPEGNPETGGLLDDFVFCSFSEDNGKTWGRMQEIPCLWGHHVEASAPALVLKNGTLITPIAGFPSWDGTESLPIKGIALRSEDNGKTWDDSSICMDFGEKKVLCYEQRMCQIDSGKVVCIAWNEDIETGERLPNHYSISNDNGKTWSKPKSTGIMGQSSSVCAIGGEKILAVHGLRRDTQRPGIYGYIVDLSNGEWEIKEELLLWEPKTPMVKIEHFAEVFSFIKFGQPGAIKLSDGNALVSHWYCEDGQYRTAVTKIEI